METGRPAVVTISREYGAAGNPIAHGLAERLGWELLGDEIPAELARALGTSKDEVEARAEQAPPFVERLALGLAAATPELGFSHAPAPDAFDGAVRAEIERRMRERAAAGDVVILGRCGSAVLGPQPRLLRVFLFAPAAWRARRVAESLQLAPAAARAEVERVDAARRRFARDRYGFGWGELANYDVLLDPSRLGIEAAIATIAAAVTERAS